jgi:hypothetical protein
LIIFVRNFKTKQTMATKTKQVNTDDKFVKLLSIVMPRHKVTTEAVNALAASLARGKELVK